MGGAMEMKRAKMKSERRREGFELSISGFRDSSEPIL
jgi:hypothetical protein